MIASTGVPPTGRSRAFANRFRGFQRAKRLIGGSSLTGVSVATGVRRSRTRINPCFRAARTHAPVRRCSSLIEISFMCHIVTHRWSTGKPLAHSSRNVRRSSRTRRKALGIGAQASANGAGRPNTLVVPPTDASIGSIEATVAAAGHRAQHQNPGQP